MYRLSKGKCPIICRELMRPHSSCIDPPRSKLETKLPTKTVLDRCYTLELVPTRASVKASSLMIFGILISVDIPSCSVSDVSLDLNASESKIVTLRTSF